MSLTEGLLALAGAVLLLLLIQGAWVSWRARPRRADAAAAPRLEPRLDEGSEVLPAGSGGSAADSGAPARPDGGVDASSPLVSPDGLTGPARGGAARLRAPALIDPLIDAVAEIALEAPLAAEAALAALPSTRRAGSKPMCIEGLNAETGEWEAPRHGQRYSAFQAGVQMANRAGALNEIEYSEFVQKVQTFADAVGGAVEFTDMLEIVGRARELDDFAHAHDAQLTVHVRARSTAWTVGYLEQMAARHGMVAAGRAGQLNLPAADADAPALVCVRFDARAALSDDPNDAALREFTVLLDVPQSAQQEEPFAQWQRLAAALARDMDGEMIDDDGRPVSIQQFASIHHQLERLYVALAARELPAGAPATRRLFS